MGNILYYFIIYPIELIIEVAFYTIHHISGNPGIAIIGVSLIVNFLAYPLYKRADAIQEAERNKQEEMSRWTDHIRKHFKGDERVMMLSAYYREQHYQPYYTLRSSVSLLLQIPFFIAAYHFLSHLSKLNGASFLFISDLSQPDALIRLGAFSVNLLPILMTLFNFCSAAIYTRGFSWKNKWQLYAIAVIFLVLLYNRPSGLVFYWTLNNLFSLLKNVFTKLLKLSGNKEKPAVDTKTEPAPEEKSYAPLRVFITGVALLAVLMGLLIPSAVIASSPTEFIEADASRNPLVYVFNTFCVSAGMFLLWFSIFYALATARIRDRFCFAVFCLSGIFLADYFFFGKNLGTMSSFLVFDEEPYYSLWNRAGNIILLCVIIALFFVIWRRFRKNLAWIYLVGLISLIIMSLINIINIGKVLKDSDYISSDRIDVKSDQILTLSKTGKNVVFIMLDRAIGVYGPYIFAEKPELKEQFSGFTLFPNTISFGTCTNIGTPPLFGGYEYTPTEINKRSSESLASKQNEADLMLPVLFSENGFKTTVCDPPYVNYHYAGDLSIFDAYPEIDAYNTRNPNAQPAQQARATTRKRVFFMYSVFKVAPTLLQRAVYCEGDYRLYLSENTDPFTKAAFMDSYVVLENLGSMTMVDDSPDNTYFSLVNDITHEPQELQLPYYEPAGNVRNSGLETYFRTDDEGNVLDLEKPNHYYVNMAAMLQIGKWLDYLKENGVYDNTRIIIAADHGRRLHEVESLLIDDDDMMDVNPLFLYKDFDAKEFNISDEFMTHADAPALAVEGLIDNPVNPFTGKEINSDEKTAHDQLVTMSRHWDVLKYNGNTFDTSDRSWYAVHDNIFDKNNWKKTENPE
ncbi:MAG: membrane protein insertase YidC [Lachnospiraceae bacterium]|nr:membrane protein insertase YidC [Lachnospiraceae bacterium]